MKKNERVMGKKMQKMLALPLASRVIGKIRIYGQIGSGMMPIPSYGGVNPDRIIKKIRWAAGRNVRALIFEINSPGGAVLPSKEIAEYIKKLDIPTVAWIRDLGASGAYWIASACDRIVADPCSGVGSIGVISSHLEFSGMMKKYGVGYQGYKTGEFKDMGVPFRKPTEKEKSSIQEHINNIHSRFVKSVAENRGLDPRKIGRLANGKLYLGDEAKKAGLVDQLGGRSEAIRMCESLGKFKHIMVAEIEDPREELMVALRSFLSIAPMGIGRGISEGLFDKMSSGFGINFR